MLEDLSCLEIIQGERTSSLGDQEELKKIFPATWGQPIVTARIGVGKKGIPLKVGVVFSGGQAPGGHNVVAALWDGLQQLHPESRLWGFLEGPSGIIEGKFKELSEEEIAPFRNQGGFDLLGSGRTKIETEEQLEKALQAVEHLNLNGLVVVGGDDSNTNAALLAEYFLNKGCATQVVGVPKTIDGDLKNHWVKSSFGFDTACKTYAEMIGNIERDALSAKKYYHFIKLMGRSASHITLECALATHPNFAWIGEEVAAENLTLQQITDRLVGLIQKRASLGKHYGVILIPEGLIEFIPEIGGLIQELNQLTDTSRLEENLSADALSCFKTLPEVIQQQLLFDRDPHGNVRVSLIETERLLIEMVQRHYKGTFHPVSHFFGYEGRAALPSNFDTHYCYTLGLTAVLLLKEGLTGYMCSTGNLSLPVEEWTPGGIPIAMLMRMEMRKGKRKPVIEKALVDLNSKQFQEFVKQRGSWMFEDHYRFPGPIQFFGDRALTDTTPLTL